MTPPEDALWFLPLGGSGEIGINLNLYGHDGRWLMVDCGIGFEQAGLNKRVIVPAIDFIAERRDRLAALLVTHAHEDHVGAVAHHWPRLRCPVYCTAFTAAILRRKLAEAGLADQVPVREVVSGTHTHHDVFDVQWLHITHSVPESQSLVIRTAAGAVLHTGDWKLDPSPVIGPGYDAGPLRRLADESSLAVVCDSTNALVEGHSVSEGKLYRDLHARVAGAEGRVVVGCFGSNVARLATLSSVAHACGRYVALMGRSLNNYVSAARTAGLWQPPRELAPPGHLGYLPRNEVLAIATGCQGEAYAALDRLSRNVSRDMDMEAGDTVIFSARVIPGNENAVAALKSRFDAMGVHVVNADEGELHASGHPARDELRALYRWVQPTIAVPVHGEEPQLQAHASLARETGVPSVLSPRNGDLVQFAPQPAVFRDRAPTGREVIERNR